MLSNGCGETNSTATDPNGNLSGMESEQIKTNEIIITKTQFEDAGMELGNVRPQSFTNKIQTNGYIDVPPQNRVEISAYFGGFVKRMDMLVGDKVNKGQTLVMLTSPEYIQMQQEYLETREQLAFLKEEFERQKTLADENIASKKSMLKAQSEYYSMVARNKGLEEKLKMLNINLRNVQQGIFDSEVRILAPISGSVAKLNVNVGSFVSPEEIIMEIINTEHVHLELQVFEKDILKVKPGLDIRFRVPDAGPEVYNGEVHLVGKSIDGELRAVKVHGHLDDEDHNFVAGMYIEAEIVTDSVMGQSLPRDAIVRVGDHDYVLSVAEQKDDLIRLVRKHVNLGRVSDEHVEVLPENQISGKEKILVKGAFSLISE